MREKHLSHAVSLATIVLSARRQFGHALRDAAMARIKTRAVSAYLDQPIIPSRVLDLHVDDALYLISRDGIDALESNVRFAVDEITRETLEIVRKGRATG